MKNSHLILVVFIVSISFLQINCKDDPPVNPSEPKLILSLENVDQRIVKIKLTATVVPMNCIVERDNFTLYAGLLQQLEIILSDTSVMPGIQYTYKAYVLNNNSRKDSAMLQVTTLEPDSTIHEFTWEIDTIGTWQSSAIDVWGSSSDNVYLAGYFYNPDSTMAGTSIMHWDGKKWKPENFWEGDMYAIYGFSANDIWVGGSNGVNIVIGHWNGQKWTKTELGKGQLTGFWGTSSKNIIATLGSGKTLFYDGNSWLQKETGTNIFLSDVWGFSENAVYACGYDDSNGSGVLLFYDGLKWNKIYERNFNSPIEPYGNTTTVWGYDTLHVYIYTPYGKYIGNKDGWNKIIMPNDNVRIQSIRGNSFKNIFAVGGFGLMMHWNGKNWKRYEQFFQHQGMGANFNGVWAIKQNVFIVGRSPDARGIVYRGKQ